MVQLLFLVFGVALCQQPLWSQHENAAVYTSAGITAYQPNPPYFAAGTWLNQPVYAEAFGTNPNGVPLWHYDSSDNMAEFAVSTARHIDSTPAGPVDIAVAEWLEDQYVCNLYGFISSGNGQPVWTYTVPQCYADVMDETWNVLHISDDGSTVAFALQSNTSASGQNYTSPTNQLRVLNAQTGAVLFVYDMGPLVPPSALSCWSDRYGAYWAFTVSEAIYVINSPSGTLRTAPIIRNYAAAAHICPMGVFLTYGFESAIISKWNSTTSVYDIIANIPGNGTWYVWTSRTSVNGGGSQPNGCLVAFGWTNGPVKQIRVDVYSMLHLNNYWTWFSAKDYEDQTLPTLSWHMNYLAVGTWGGQQARTPTIFLFNLLSNVPIFNYTTPGSMFAIEVLVNNAAIPSSTMGKEALGMKSIDYQEKMKYLNEQKQQTVAATNDTIYLIAAGKDVAASQFGSGGDCYAFQLSFPSTS